VHSITIGQIEQRAPAIRSLRHRQRIGAPSLCQRNSEHLHFCIRPFTCWGYRSVWTTGHRWSEPRLHSLVLCAA